MIRSNDYKFGAEHFVVPVADTGDESERDPMPSRRFSSRGSDSEVGI